MITEERIKEIKLTAGVSPMFASEAVAIMHLNELLAERKQLVKIAKYSHNIKSQYDFAWKNGKVKKSGLFCLMKCLGHCLDEWMGNNENTKM